MKKVGLILLTTCLVSAFIFGMIVSANSNFKDVSNDFWAKKEIDFLHSKKIINGYPNGNFGPNDTVRRVDAASMIVRALELDTTNRPNPNFRDITRNSYGFDDIATVVDEGIFNGIDGNFQPNQTLTRAQMAAIITRAYNLENKNNRISFKDVDSKFWAYKDIQTLVGHGITKGYPDNTFKPNQPTTRAEFSTFLTRVMQNHEEKPADKAPTEKPSDTFEVIDIR